MRTPLSRIVPLSAAVADLVHDGDTVALEGFTHLIPVAAGHEVIRRRRRDLTLVRMTPDIVYDQLISAGCARKLVFSWGGNRGVGSLHRFRDAIQNAWPAPLEIEEHSHAGLAQQLTAVPALELDVAIVHAQRSDREGNVPSTPSRRARRPGGTWPSPTNCRPRPSRPTRSWRRCASSRPR